MSDRTNGVKGIGLVVLLLAQAALALPVFTDVTQKAGIDFKHSYGDYKLDNIVEGTGAGACFFDYNGDGFADIYFVTGVWEKTVSDNQGRDLRGKLSNKLFRNKGDGTFEDVTAKAKVDGKGIYSTGCSAADYDNDGDVDLYVLTYKRNILYRNNGDGTFSNASRISGLADPRWGLSAVWFDYDRDGDLDVYVGNYLEYDAGKFRDFYAAKGYPGPLSYKGQPDALYRNNGNGTFTDVTKRAGVFTPQGRAMSVTATDLNNDGWLDIYVANDAMENLYFENQSNGKFKDKGLEKGLSFSEHGQGVSSMGPTVGDVDRNGYLDIFIPDLRYNTLLMHRGDRFEDRTQQAGLSVVLGQYSGWGAVIFDYDHDRWLDIFTVHGHAHFEFVQEDTLLRNKGDGTFDDVSKKSGTFFEKKYVGRGASWADYDNDGDVDLLIVNLNDSPRLIRNDGGNTQNWLALELNLTLPKGKRSALGARVTVTSDSLRQTEELIPTRGYLSQGQARLHFGLGKADQADEVEVRWPDGTKEVHKKVKANQILKLDHKFSRKRGRS